MHQIKQSSNTKKSEHNISYAFFLNLGFTIIEIIGGILTNSVAILSDAIHDFGDSISLGLAWYFEKIAKRKSNRTYSYGYKRFSLLGAVINSVILLAGSVLILFETVPRLLNPQETNVKGMFLLAVLGIIINGAAVLKLRKGKTLNEKVVSLHLWEDVLGWIAILVGSICMYFFDLPVIDPMLSILITVYILIHVFRNIRTSMRIILQGTPEEIDPETIQKNILQLPDVSGLHDIHTWSIDGNYHIITLHVVLNRDLSMQDQAGLKKNIRNKLASLHINHATIEFETADEDCGFEFCQDE